MPKTHKDEHDVTYAKSIKIAVPLAVLLAAGILLATRGDSPSEAAAAAGQTLAIVDPFTSPTPDGATVGAVFAKIVNPTNKADRLVGVQCAAAREMQMHETVEEGGVLRMVHRPEGYEIPARGVMELKPGGAHLMLIDLFAPLRMGETIAVKLVFREAGIMEITVPVKDMLSAATSCCATKDG